MDNSSKDAPESSQNLGLEEPFGLIPKFRVDRSESEVLDLDHVKIYCGDLTLSAAPYWITYLTEMFLEVQTVDQFRFSALLHFVVDTPVHAATDHPEWADDVVTNFHFYTASSALITTATHMFRRGCGRYLYEVPNLYFTSEVAWPVRNYHHIMIDGHFRTQVTAC